MSIIMDMCEKFATTDDVQSMLTTSAASDVGRSIELEGVCKQLNSRVLAVEQSLQQQTAQQTRQTLSSKYARPASSHPSDTLSVRHLSYYLMPLRRTNRVRNECAGLSLLPFGCQEGVPPTPAAGTSSAK